ncbi:MAG: hypothetical protein Q8J74_06015 [Candidatus Didemnitutus sp.]|nr:hypothetical protein [Candidatus Didemnitutus sp.]
MKRTCLLLVALVCTAPSFAAENFTGALTETERRETGIDGLTAAQRARLDELVERYTHGEVDRGVTEAIEEKLDQESIVNPRKGQKVIETRLVGEFKGWTGGTIFRLENGQVWQQRNPEFFETSRPVTNPTVVLKKSMIGGYWLHVEGFQGVRVKRLE